MLSSPGVSRARASSSVFGSVFGDFLIPLFYHFLFTASRVKRYRSQKASHLRSKICKLLLVAICIATGLVISANLSQFVSCEIGLSHHPLRVPARISLSRCLAASALFPSQGPSQSEQVCSPVS